MSDFTPGPWIIGRFPDDWDVGGPDGGNSSANCITCKSDDVIAAVYGDYPEVGHRQANARLIAAAPDQNAALNYVADMTYCGANGKWYFKPGYDPQIVLDAIAKATGDKP